MIQQVIPSAITEFIHEVGEHHLPDLHTHLLTAYQEKGVLVNWPVIRILQYIFGTVFSYLLPVILDIQSQFDLNAAVNEAVTFLERGLQGEVAYPAPPTHEN